MHGVLIKMRPMLDLLIVQIPLHWLFLLSCVLCIVWSVALRVVRCVHWGHSGVQVSANARPFDFLICKSVLVENVCVIWLEVLKPCEVVRISQVISRIQEGEEKIRLRCFSRHVRRENV